MILLARRITTYEWTWTTGGGKSKAAPFDVAQGRSSHKGRGKWAPDYIIMSIRTTSCMATLMILSKSRPCESERPPTWRMCTPMATKISALLSALVILLLPVVSCGGCPATPSITSLSPSSATAGGAGFSLTVNGGSFSSNAVVVWNGSPLTTSFVNSKQITAAISATQIAQPDTAVVYVYNPTSSGTKTVGAGSVTATNSNSCNAQGSNAVSFTVSP